MAVKLLNYLIFTFYILVLQVFNCEAKSCHISIDRELQVSSAGEVLSNLPEAEDPVFLYEFISSELYKGQQIQSLINKCLILLTELGEVEYDFTELSKREKQFPNIDKEIHISGHNGVQRFKSLYVFVPFIKDLCLKTKSSENILYLSDIGKVVSYNEMEYYVYQLRKILI